MAGPVGFGNLGTVLAVAASLGLSACDGGGWFGEQEGPPLPGERIPVLVHARQLTPDEGTANVPIRLPPPSVNREWPQAGGYASHAMHHIAINETINNVWQADVGSNTHGWGCGTSPVLYKNLVIVNASVESGSLVAA